MGLYHPARLRAWWVWARSEAMREPEGRAMANIRYTSLLRLWAAATLMVFLSAPALSATRVALVIGNSAYANASQLANPLNDAADIGAALGRLGFEVTRLEDAGYAALRRGLQSFRREASGARIAVVFYAGHGIEVNRNNFLVPVDARLQTDGDVEYEAVPLDLVMRAVEGASEFRLVVLDACRDNPFLASMEREEGSTRSIGRGLARTEPTSGGTLLAYSAKEGTVALDGKGRNSPYVGALLRFLEEPGLEVGLMFRKVRDAVLESTGGDQEPFAYGSLSARGTYFIPPVSDEQGDGTKAAQSDVEVEYWRTVNSIPDPSDRIVALLEYKERFPDGVYAGLADIQLKGLGEPPDESDKTMERLSGESAEAALGLSREDRRRIQLALSAAGFESGPPDGLLGPRTRAAISDWQEAQGMEPTGYLEADGLAALFAPVSELQGEASSAARPAMASDPSTIVLASGLRLSDWVLLAEDRLVDGDYRKLLVEGMSHTRAYGSHASVETIVAQSLEGLVKQLRVTDEASAQSALGIVKQIRDVAGERTELARIEGKARVRLGQFSEAAQAYRTWLRLAPPDHPERRRMLARLQQVERGEHGPLVGDVFRDCEDGCPELVVVPPGSFMMGSPLVAWGRDEDEAPVHEVTISQAFAVGVFEVTFDEWDACRRDWGCWHLPDDKVWGRGKRPVINVSWEDAQEYVGWLSAKTGKPYRLLSESEWEYVARGGTSSPFHYGETLSTDLANHAGNKQTGNRQTLPAGQFPPNSFGLHDVHGNVFEWVEDCWHNDYRGAPRNGTAWTSGDNCSLRVMRGGSWTDLPRKLRSAYRGRNIFAFRGSYVGFRVARSLD